MGKKNQETKEILLQLLTWQQTEAPVLDIEIPIFSI
jgi:hypothetical protein